ncbi:cysteine protease ATG4B-like isoform X2 [Apostichopus japonicus]|uniref:cysteine protease ATG4B-like isoform X2 n=1 Tax=Stichopus japonicus TaxID=307972 RepID=UPI003AB83E50
MESFNSLSSSTESGDFIACVTYESINSVVVEPFPPQNAGPMWILGRQFDCTRDQHQIKEFVHSRLWITYRKNFSPIGGVGPNTDQGWGCMLRCGQMMLAQALICRHLGKDWVWNKHNPDEDYIKVLKMFLDKKDSSYSIHQIAQMGVSEGKDVGHWYGPNTVAQVLKKLAAFDRWSNIAVHVALDNTVVKEDIRALCRTAVQGNKPSFHKPRSEHVFQEQGANGPLYLAASESSSSSWKPLVLFIPLRLGLNEINNVYINRLTNCFKLPQSLGVIGGKPNHAHYFIGVHDKNLVFLDPHTTQPTVDFDQWGHIADESYHCASVSTMLISSLDPSIALGFYCRTEAEFEDWCHRIQCVISEKEFSPMFEVTETRPIHWPPFHESGETEESFEITEFDYPREDEDSDGFEHV